MNFTQPPPNYLPQRTPVPMNLNPTKFTNRAPGRAPHPGAVHHSNHSFGPRHKSPQGHTQNIPHRHFQGRGGPVGVSYVPGPPIPSPGQIMYQSNQTAMGQFANGQVLKQQNGFHGVGHSHMTTLVQNNLLLGGGQARHQGVVHVGHNNGIIVNGIHHGQVSEASVSESPVPCIAPGQAPSPHQIQAGVSVLPQHPMVPGVAVPPGVGYLSPAQGEASGMHGQEYRYQGRACG